MSSDNTSSRQSSVKWFYSVQLSFPVYNVNIVIAIPVPQTYYEVPTLAKTFEKCLAQKARGVSLHKGKK